MQLMVDEVMLEAQVPTLPVKCQGVDGSKLKTKCDTLEPLIQASILACDESKYNIGSCINKITSMFSKRSEFEVGSEEYEEMNSRLLLGLMISQGYIDFKKNGTVVMDMPEHWYKLDACKNDWERKLCADKKPYFLATYKPKKNKSKFKTNFKDYKQTMEIIHTRAVAHWGITGEELLSMSKDELTDEQAEFVEYYTNMCEVYLRDNSTQHRLCIATEDAIGKLSYTDNIVNCKHLFKDERVKNNPKVTKEVRNLYEKYTKDIANIHATDVDENGFSCIDILRQELYADLVGLHEDIVVVYNSFVDVVYSTKSTLLFELFGDMVIDNLARKNNYEMRIPVADDNGGYEYQSKRFRIEVQKLKG